MTIVGGVDLRQLRYLLAVADERHFGRAAAALYISQPSLSAAIKGLERELGVQLLRRDARGVEVTAVGGLVVDEARRALQAADRVTGVVEDYRRGRVGRLRIGFEATGAGELGTIARRRFTQRFPGVQVELRRYEWGGEADAVRRGEVDLAYVWLPCDPRGLHLDVVATEPRFLGVCTGHRLAARQAVTVADLAGEPLMTTSRAPRAWVDWWAINPRPDGSEVVWGPENDSVEECFEQVAAGAAACICPASMVDFYHRPDLRWVPIRDAEPLRVALAHLLGPISPAAQAFTDVVQEVARERSAA